MDITTPPLPPVAPEVLRVAEHRHKKGLMYPYIFHVLTKVLPRPPRTSFKYVTALRIPGSLLQTSFLSFFLFDLYEIFPVFKP